MLPLWHIKEPGHSAKSAGSRLHVNTAVVGDMPLPSLVRNQIVLHTAVVGDITCKKSDCVTHCSDRLHTVTITGKKSDCATHWSVR